MKRIAGLVAFLLFFLPAALPQQEKIKILLLGTTHSFKGNPNQNFNEVIATLASFKPDMICIEALPVEDTATIKKYRAASYRKADSMRVQSGLTDIKIKRAVRACRKKLAKTPSDIELHLKLANLLFMQYDFRGNSDYHWWQANYYSIQQNQATKDSSLAAFLQRSKFNEYYNVVFPLANGLGIKYFILVDDQTYYPDDITAQKKAQDSLLITPKGVEAIKQISQAQAAFSKYEKQGRLFDLLNDTAYQNKVSDIIINAYPKWSTTVSTKLVSELWKKRNHLIAQRIIGAIAKAPATERVLVTLGAAHIPILKSYLSAYQNFEIIDFDELKAKK